MSASLQVGAAPSLFTIEQIELVRRLRNSGMTKESIIEAYESFDRLEGELGNLFNIPRTTAPTTALAQQPNQQTAPAGFVSPAVTQASSSNTPVIAGVSSLAAGSFGSAASNFSPSSTGTSNFGGNYAGFTSPTANYTTATTSGLSSVERASFAHFGTGNLGAPHFAGGNSKYFASNSEHAGFPSPKLAKRPKLDGMDAEDIGGGSVDQMEQGNFALAEDMVNELDAFLRKGFTAAVEEIRKYVCDNSIKQTQIATQSNISQPYISRFLRGDGRDMSERSRCSIYLWYLRHKKGVFDISSSSNSSSGQESVRLPPASTLLQLSRGRDGYTPESLGHHITAVNLAVQQSPLTMDLSQMVPETVVKRERFTFRSIHREILEEFFAQQQYPNQEEREVLAKQCNEALQKFIGHELCDREMMTTTHVANWFNNRRKEIKRLAREEGISTSEVVLPARSRSPPLRKHLAALASAASSTSSPASANSERAQPEDDVSTFDSYVVLPADQDSPIEIKEEAED